LHFFSFSFFFQVPPGLPLEVKAEQPQDDLVDRLPTIVKTQGAIAVVQG